MDPERLDLPSASFTLRYHCLGAWNLINALKVKGLIPEEETSPASQSGTEIHAARAGEDVELDDNQEDMRNTLERIEKKTAELLLADFTKHSTEQRLWLRKGLRPIFSGRYDYAYVDISQGVPIAAIFDDKTGREEVDPAECNFQMRDLAALWHYTYPGTDRVYTIILQPRITHEPSIALYDSGQLSKSLKLLRENLEQIADPEAPRTPGHHCRHCPARAHCDETKNYSIQSPRLLLERIERGEVNLPIDEKGARVLESIEVGYKVLDKLWNLYESIVTFNPDAVPGWYMSEGSDRRKITDYARARQIMTEAGLPDSELDEATRFAIDPLEKFFCNRAGVPQYKAKQRFNELLADVMKISRDKKSLKPIPKRGRKALRKAAE